MRDHPGILARSIRAVAILACLAGTVGCSRAEPPHATPAKKPATYSKEPEQADDTALFAANPAAINAMAREGKDGWAPGRLLAVTRSPSDRVAIPLAPDCALNAWREEAKVRVGVGSLERADLSADGRLLLVRSPSDGMVRIYDALSLGKVAEWRLPEHRELDRSDVAFWAVETSPATVVYGCEKGLFLLDAMTGETRRVLDDRPVSNLAWSPDRRVLVTARHDFATQSSVLSFIPVAEMVEKNRWDVAARTVDLPFGQRTDGFDLSDDGTLLAVSLYPGNTLALFDLATMKMRWSVPAPEFSGSVDLSPDGRFAAVGGAWLLLVSADHPEVRAELRGFDNNIHRVRFIPGCAALAASSYDGRIRIAAVQEPGLGLKLVKTLRHQGHANVYDLVFTPDGRTFFSTSGDKTVRRFVRP